MRHATSKKITVVGQTPPPFGGQTVMIQKMLEGDYGPIELCHVRMAFSKGMEEVGRFKVRKLFELGRVIAQIIKTRFTQRADVLWYPPASPDLVPVLRDLVILGTTRWLFRKTIFHFHAGGVADFEKELPAALRPLFRRAYARPDVAVRVSAFTPEDGKKLRAKQEYVVHNAVEDEYASYTNGRAPRNGCTAEANEGAPTVLLVGRLHREKGVMTLLEACRLLAEQGVAFRVRFVGKFETEAFEQKVRAFIERHGLTERIAFAGVLTGKPKLEAFASADVFCLPTHFETFGLVLVEALSFALPVVSTRTGGVPIVVQDEECGFLVPVEDAPALAEKLALLLQDAALRQTMGEKGRAHYLKHFTIETYHERLKEVFAAAVET